jgi:hypothetical protein
MQEMSIANVSGVSAYEARVSQSKRAEAAATHSRTTPVASDAQYAHDPLDGAAWDVKVADPPDREPPRAERQAMAHDPYANKSWLIDRRKGGRVDIRA